MNKMFRLTGHFLLLVFWLVGMATALVVPIFMILWLIGAGFWISACTAANAAKELTK